jgi:hypothetical protein
LQDREELIEPLAPIERARQIFVRFPFGELARVDPREQLTDRAAERER